MGIEVAAVVLAGVAAASKAGQMVAETQAAKQKEDALDLQSRQQTLVYQQKTLSNYDVMEKVLDAQTAAMTTRGVGFESPSFNAIQRATYNVGAKKQRNLDIEEDLGQANIDLEKDNVKKTLHAQLFGDASSLAISALAFGRNMPTQGG
ncbi:hypothetical protein KW791_00080 [Candidatus Parcubacteria bacterium]|nr:hypothetical protein [Candidatus Parcubacteria bacterium]